LKTLKIEIKYKIKFGLRKVKIQRSRRRNIKVITNLNKYYKKQIEKRLNYSNGNYK
jgi:hypothetical protein